ncbi:MAG: VOC family protein [Alphaproteobacteria bacterium]
MSPQAATQGSPGFAVLGLDHVVLAVADMERALAFYVGVLGLREERRLDSIGLVQLRAGASMVDLVPAKPGDAGGRNMDHFAIRLAPWDPDAIRAHLAAAGFPAPEPAMRYGAEGSGWSIYVDDPDGNVVELKGPRVPDAG